MRVRQVVADAFCAVFTCYARDALANTDIKSAGNRRAGESADGCVTKTRIVVMEGTKPDGCITVPVDVSEERTSTDGCIWPNPVGDRRGAGNIILERLKTDCRVAITDSVVEECSIAKCGIGGACRVEENRESSISRVGGARGVA